MIVNTSSIISLVALLFYGSLVWIVLSRDVKNRVIRSFSLYLAAMILWCFGAFMVFGGFAWADLVFWDRFRLVGWMAMPVAFFSFVQAFLMHEKRNWEVFGVVCYLLILAADIFGYLVSGTQVANGQIVHNYGPAFLPASIVWIFFVGFSMINLIQDFRKTRVAIFRNQIKYLVVTVILTLAGILFNFSNQITFPIDIAFNIAAAAFIAYAIFKHQLLDLTIVVRKWLLYLIPTVIIAAIYFGIVYLLMAVYHAVSGFGIIILALTVAILVALIGQPLHRQVQNWIDRFFYREKYNASQMLRRLSLAAVSVLDLDTITNRILTEVTTTMHIRQAGLFLKKDQSGEFFLMAQVGMKPGEVKFMPKHPLVVYFQGNDQALTEYDLEILPVFLALWKQERLDLGRMGAKLYIPLKAKGDLVGIFAVGSKMSGEAYSQDDQLTLDTLANQIAAAIENALLFTAETRRRREAETMQKALMGLTSDLDLQRVLDNILAQLEKAIPYDSACVFLQENDQLKAVAARGFTRPEEIINRIFPLESDRLFQEMRSSRRPLILSDAQADSRLKGYGETKNVRSWMGIPLILRGVVTGCLTLDSYTQDSYSELELADLALEFANHAAVAVENARLFNVERDQRRNADSLREVGTMLSSTLDFDRTLDLLLDQIGRILPYDIVNILLSDGDHHFRVARTRVADSVDPSLALHVDDAIAELTEMPNLNPMISTQRAMVIPDLSKDPAWIQKTSLPVRSWVGVPVIIDDKVVACFSLVKYQANFYTERHSSLLSVLAGQAALALQNARLFTEVQQLAIIDDLTSIFNRRHLIDLGTREFNRAQRFKRSLAVIMLDLDYFRNVNDTYGHAVGDEVLRLVADRCKKSIREVDVIGRYGGEEFTVICPESGLEEAQTVSERLRKQIGGAPFITSAGPVTLTASLGIGVKTDDMQDILSLVGHADKAMYVAKHNGRDHVGQPGETDLKK